ncbi:transmembrane protein [Thraustotheca clavata]|uniref:Transmembrane protein n=1 Tax=Thraustotheca clavata TaxID=74557 RepID=A0A1V9YTM8_9STRA|nr:transmembrane protein [Thraustotheca clavata]
MSSNYSRNSKIWLFDEADLMKVPDTTMATLDSSDYEITSKVADYEQGTDDQYFTGDALREGGALDLHSREAIGILGQYAAVGMVYGCLPALVYPVYVKYLNYDGYQSASYTVLVTLCWSFKVFLGMLTDCFPIGGYKRRPYMVIGWVICIISLCLMAFKPFPDSYIGKGLAGTSPHDITKIRGGNFSALTPDQVAMVNKNAPETGVYWILLSTLASFGYMMSDVAADAMVVQYAQREPIYIRGRIQSAIYSVRYACSMIPLLVIGVCMNGQQYDGSFNWSISPNIIFAMLIFPCIFAIWCTLFLVVEERDVKPYFWSYMQSLWSLMCRRVTWQICAFRFFSNFFYNFDSTVTLIIPSLWANVQPLTKSIFSVLNAMITSFAIYVCGRYGLNWNWRSTIAITTLCVMLIDSSVIMMTIWGVVRNQYFFTTSLLPDSLPAGIRFIISGYCAVEIADIGNEGMVFGLVTTIVNLATPFSTVCYKFIDSYFTLSSQDLAADTNSVRWSVTYSYFVAYAFKLISLSFLVLLPPQKAAVQKLKRTGGSSRKAAIILTAGFIIALLFSIITNIMALYPQTSCYRIAGGNGYPVVKNNVTICEEPGHKVWLFDEADLTRQHNNSINESPSMYAQALQTKNEFDDKDDNGFLPDGAIREGGALELTSREAIGLLGQYASVGVIYGCLPALAYPVYVKYMNFTGYQAASYTVLVTLCWSFKVFLGMITDCFPIGGYKRRPYMIIGWAICCSCMCLMAFVPFPDPYISKTLGKLPAATISKVRGGDFSNLTAAQKEMVNINVADSSNYWILLSTLGSFGYMLADVAADAMVVEYAHREPIHIRGRLQSAIYSVRYACSMIPLLVVGVCMNGPEYDGSFNWSMGPNLIFGMLIFPCAFAIWAVIFLVVEERGVKPYFWSYLQNLWHLLRLRVMWQICAFRFFSNFFYNFDSTVTLIIPSIWATVQPLTKSVFAVLNAMLVAIAIYICGRYGLNWNWRITIALTTIGVMIIDGTILALTTWNIIRNEFFFTSTLLPDSLPSGIRFIVSGYCAVEIADIGNEGVVFGLVTTIVNLATPFSTVCYKFADSYFELTSADLVRDTNDVRWSVTYSYIFAYSFKLVSFAFLPLLPPQKAAVQKLKRTGRSSSRAATAVVVVFFGALTFSVVTNIMALFPQTSCYRIAGGSGTPTIKDNITICG